MDTPVISQGDDGRDCQDPLCTEKINNNLNSDYFFLPRTITNIGSSASN
jgi:hypothetical protein